MYGAHELRIILAGRSGETTAARPSVVVRHECTDGVGGREVAAINRLFAAGARAPSPSISRCRRRRRKNAERTAPPPATLERGPRGPRPTSSTGFRVRGGWGWGGTREFSRDRRRTSSPTDGQQSPPSAARTGARAKHRCCRRGCGDSPRARFCCVRAPAPPRRAPRADRPAGRVSRGEVVAAVSGVSSSDAMSHTARKHARTQRRSTCLYTEHTAARTRARDTERARHSHAHARQLDGGRGYGRTGERTHAPAPSTDRPT